MTAVIALLLVLGSLSGCAGDTMLNVRNALPEASASPAYVVQLQNWEDSVQNAEGETIVEYDCQVPVLSVVNGEGQPASGKSPEERMALERAAVFNAQFDQWREVSGNMDVLADNAEVFKEAFGFSAVMSEKLSCSVYQSEHFISVSGVYLSYTGGLHSNTMLMSWNFDLETGSFFDPQLLGSKTDLQTAVYDELVRQSQTIAAEHSQSPDEFFWPDYTGILENWSSYAVSFDDSGMTVGFSPYELACYAAGPQQFHIPYDVLLPHLDRDACLFLGIDKHTS